MKDFFKFLLASCLGIVLAVVSLSIIGVSIVAGLASAAGEATSTEIKNNTVLELKLNGAVPEMTDNVELDPFQSEKVSGIHVLVKAIAQAKTDDKIKGIYVNTQSLMVGISNAALLRNALLDFKSSGKFVLAYGDDFSQGGYYLASASDQIFLNPNGSVDFRGLASEIPFMKTLFDRLEVKWQVYYAGQFKSATEPFRLDKMSDQNKLQVRETLSGIYDVYLSEVAASRRLDKNNLQQLANNYSVRMAKDAKNYGLVDSVAYYDAFIGVLQQKLGLAAKDKVNVVSINDYAQNVKFEGGSGKAKIAVVFAEGDIVYGSEDGQTGVIDGVQYAKIIRKLRNDDNVKAIVLRINSGGGSSFASDVIWRELDLARKQGKPVMASFGDYAASGGYYIACASDSIFAQPTTLTGSIGVFGMIPSVQKMLKNKVGIAFDTVKTGKYAASFSPLFEFTDEEGRFIQESVDSTYEQFLRRVGDCRHMGRDQVHAIAQGRVWLGSKGKEIGLVDKIGSLQDAINAAAQKAGLSSYKLAAYPRPKSGIEQFIARLTGDKGDDSGIRAAFIKRELGEYASYYDVFRQIKQMKGPQMRVPYVVRFR